MGYDIDAVTENCYEGTTCLINKLGITNEVLLSELEAEITFAKASQLETEPISSSFDFQHYKKFTNIFLKICMTGQVKPERLIFLKKERILSTVMTLKKLLKCALTG